LAKKSFFKSWMALPIIAVVALAGYAIVQFSQASNIFYSFEKSASFMQGGNLLNWPAPVGRIRLLEFGQSATTTLTASQIRNSSKVCSWFYSGADTTAVVISVNGSYKGSTIVKGNQNGKPSSVCTQTLGLNNTTKGGNATVSVAAGRAGIKLVRGVKVGGAGGAPPRATSPISSAGTAVTNSASTAANTAASQAAAVQAVRRGQCEAKPNYSKDRKVSGGVWRERWGYRWNGRGCDNFKISSKLECNKGYRQSGSRCIKTNLPNYGYGKSGSLKCLKGAPTYKSYKGASKYSCKARIDGKTFYFLPADLKCNNPAYYKATRLDLFWVACKKR
jgi:hypothetical protein